MTMDVRRRCLESSAPSFLTGGSGQGPRSPGSDTSGSPPASATVPPPPPKATVKRSFDVAFLMAPDDSSKKRQQMEVKQQLKLVSAGALLQRYSPLAPRRDGPPGQPPGLLKPYPEEPADDRGDFTKSAFTKVAAGRLEISPMGQMPTSPGSVSSGGPVSPDLTYQDSMSPPSSRRSPVQYYPNGKPPQYFGTKGIPQGVASPYLYQTPVQMREKPQRTSPEPSTTFPPAYMVKVDEKPPPKPRGVVYPGDVLPYSGLAMATYPFPGGFPSAGAQLLTAAANVTAALLPPSLAALTMPAQNVCAKCNVSFRMTSDLVYHMRSHHKNDSPLSDANRRRREQDKLRCPVCNETFRERHHLTRHMTAHQDKDGDRVDEDEDPAAARRRPSAGK